MPKLIIIGGSLATGKSTFAEFLEEQTGIERISMDELKERLFDVGGYRDRAWSKRVGQIAWPVFQQLVELHLEYGEHVIAEATFLWPDDAQWIRDVSARFGADVYQIWMTADPVIARERFLTRARSAQRHPGHNDSIEHVIEEFDARIFNRTFIAHPGFSTHLIDTTNFGPLEFESICRFLRLL